MNQELSANTNLSHYRIVSKLGAGGMGEVWLAEDTRLKRKVALKLLPAELTSDAERVRRFEQEAQAASALNHPNIITIHEIGQTEGRHYIATEYIEGETLRDKLSRGPLTVNETLDVAIQVAGALAAAHKAGVIHRDIKPENVMAREDGIVKVLDFGLAKLTERRSGAMGSEAPSSAKVNTDPGMVMGTVGYMAPEQARGREVDVRTDVFNLGVILYEMLTGRAPFLGETPSDVIAALLEREPPPLARLAPDTPADLRHIVNKSLRKDREERYQSVKSMLADLKALKQELEFAASLERSSSPESITALRHAPGGLVSALPEAEASDGLDLAHVLFCDIVGYSLLPIDQQTQMMRLLQEIVRQTEAYRRAEASHQLVRLPAGDGMALAFLHDLAAPVRCAMEITRALKAHPEIRLRMGAHTGPVFRSADINANRNVVGSGINMAQRVMDCGDAGHILVSRNVAEALSQVSHWKAYLHDLGEVEVKHGVRLHLSNLYDDEIGNAETPAKLKGQRAASAQPITKSSAEYLVSEFSKHKRTMALWLAVSLTAVIGAGYWLFNLRGSSGVIDSLAVLPFQNRSGAADSEFLSDGLTETLIYRLSQLQNLKVSPTSSVFRYKGKETDAQKIGGELGVNAVMTGRIAQRGENLAISVELIDVRNNKLLWGEQYERKLSELLATQREIAIEITNRLKLKLSGEGEQKLAKKDTDNNEAYQLYLKGRFHFATRTREGCLRSIELFREAIKLDPNYALAYFGVAESYAVMPSFAYMSPKEAMPSAKAALAKALELAPDLPEAHTVAAVIAAVYDWNWAEAEREFKHSLELDPNLAITHFRYAWVYLSPMGRHDEAIAEMKRAMDLEPLSLQQGANFAAVYMYARKFDLAVEQARKTCDLDPGFISGQVWLARIYSVKGMYADALRISENSPQNVARFYGAMACSYAKTGRRQEFEAVIKKWKGDEKSTYISNYWVATAYAALGDKDAAFAELEKAYQTRDWYLPRLKTDPFFDSVRDDPRFAGLVKRVGLSQ